MAENIKVAVRVRPLNSLEQSMGAHSCVDMVGPTSVKLSRVVNSKKDEKQFTFDFALWSVNDRYRLVDNHTLYQLIAQPLLLSSLEGFSSCLFAYGQTSSGKSFSMVGGTHALATTKSSGKSISEDASNTSTDLGIIQMLMNDLFARTEEQSASNGTEWLISCSLFEIYNEKLRDLLKITAANSPPIKVREDKERGIWVDGLSSVPIHTSDDFLENYLFAQRQKSVAATRMNAVSSRSHTVYQIQLQQRTPDSQIIRSSINLVDLAGSERLGRTGAEGQRAEEGKFINLSLQCLGIVIRTLADQAKSGKSGFVAYRDSELTKLLRPSLGGNSKSVMLACISPSSTNYEDTLATLRFASDIKRIKNKPTKNVLEADALRARLFSACFVASLILFCAFDSIPRSQKSHHWRLSSRPNHLDRPTLTIWSVCSANWKCTNP